MPLYDNNIRGAVDLWFGDAPAQDSAIELYGHISNWDTSAVTYMFRLFEGRPFFNEDLSKWDGMSYY
jgi:hypothetical protein